MSGCQHEGKAGEQVVEWRSVLEAECHSAQSIGQMGGVMWTSAGAEWLESQLWSAVAGPERAAGQLWVGLAQTDIFAVVQGRAVNHLLHPIHHHVQQSVHRFGHIVSRGGTGLEVGKPATQATHTGEWVHLRCGSGHRRAPSHSPILCRLHPCPFLGDYSLLEEVNLVATQHYLRLRVVRVRSQLLQPVADVEEGLLVG